MRKKAWTALLLLPLVAGVIVLVRAHRALRQSADESASSERIAFTSSPVPPAALSGVDPLGTPSSFRDIAAFSGAVYLSGPGGLSSYDQDGKLRARFRPGIELPPGALGQMTVGRISDSSRPELFIATATGGVLASDGNRFRQIVPQSSDLRRVTSLLALSTGRLLIGTETKGLLVYDGSTLRSFSDALKTDRITALAGTDGDLWIGTLAHGLQHAHAGQVDSFKRELPDPQVLSIAVKGSSTYAGTPLGVVEFREGKKYRNIASGYFAKSLDVNGSTLLIGTEDEGIITADLSTTGQSRPAVDGRIDNASVARLASIAGREFAVTSGGVYGTSTHGWRRVVEPAATMLTDSNVSALGVAPDSRIWIGYFDRGLDVLTPGLQRAAHYEDEHIFCINRIAFSGEQSSTGAHAAVATANGLVLFDSQGKPKQILGRKDGLLADHVTDVVYDPHGMTVATPAGLSFIDASGIRSLYVFHGLVNNHVYSLASFGGRTLAGTLGGISVLDNDAIEANYTTINSGLPHNWVTAIARVGDDWFAGTYGGGIVRQTQDGRWHRFSDLREGFIVNPNAIAVTPKRVYVGSLDRGLYVYDRDSQRWHETTTALPSVNVTALAASDGYIYIGTDNGIVRIAEASVR